MFLNIIFEFVVQKLSILPAKSSLTDEEVLAHILPNWICTIHGGESLRGRL